MSTNGSNGTQKSIRAPNPPVEDSVFKSFRLDGKTVIISGGSGGIGYEIARGLAEAGANVTPSYSYHQLFTDRISDRNLVLRIPHRCKASSANIRRFRRQNCHLSCPSREIRRSRSSRRISGQRLRPLGRHDCECGNSVESGRIG